MEDITVSFQQVNNILDDIEYLGTCWIYHKYVISDGYSHYRYWDSSEHKYKNAMTHRVIYEHLVGPIGHGLVLDHLCENRSCICPDHLEEVTLLENIRRGRTGQHNAQKTHCKNGHPLSGDNLYQSGRGDRGCRECRKISQRRYVAKVLV